MFYCNTMYDLKLAVTLLASTLLDDLSKRAYTHTPKLNAHTRTNFDREVAMPPLSTYDLQTVRKVRNLR